MPNASGEIVKESKSINMATILRVYDQQVNWLKISNSQQNWVNCRYTIPLLRDTVIANSL